MPVPPHRVTAATAHEAPDVSLSHSDGPSRPVPALHQSALTPRAARGHQRLLSPLRYPGAKRQLIPLFNSLLLDAPVRTFVEPFAGGASVALHVALNGLAERVVLGEADHMVYAFWRVACFDTDWLVDKIITTPVTLEAWEYFKQNPGRTNRERALACLVLNRTSFSGILHRRAGPIGGRSQTSDYPIDCRFPREELARRVNVIGEMAATGRIAAVRNSDYTRTVAHAAKRFGQAGTLVYLDPPFFAKAETLYRRSFTTKEHQRLAAYLLGCATPWVLSYDYHPAIEKLYSTPLVRLPGDPPGQGQRRHHLVRLTIAYTAHSRRGSGDEYIVTNLPTLPEQPREATR